MKVLPSTVSLRPAGAADAPALARILRASRGAAMPWLPVLHTPEEDLGFIQGRVLPTLSVTVAEESRRIAGFAAYGGGWLDHLYLDPGRRRRGIGSALLEVAKAAEPSLQLWVFQENHAARRFYGNHGFVAVEFTDGSGNEEKTPDVRMLWKSEGDVSSQS